MPLFVFMSKVHRLVFVDTLCVHLTQMSKYFVFIVCFGGWLWFIQVLFSYPLTFLLIMVIMQV